MKKANLLVKLAVVILCVVAFLAPGDISWGDDDFYVIAGGSKIGTPITSLPFTITKPGLYYLTGNLTSYDVTEGIIVASDNVTIDLKGFQLKGSGYAGIDLFDGTNCHNNVEVKNGILSGWSLGLNDYDHSSKGGTNNRAINLQVQNCDEGIYFRGDHGLVQGCTVAANDLGIQVVSGMAAGNTVSNCQTGISGGYCISGNNVSNCSTGINGYGLACYNNSVSNCSTGISGGGIISNNSVSNCTVAGIYGEGDIESNTVATIAGSIGIKSDGGAATVYSNTVSGPGTPFSASSSYSGLPQYQVYYWGNTGF